MPLESHQLSLSSVLLHYPFACLSHLVPPSHSFLMVLSSYNPAPLIWLPTNCRISLPDSLTLILHFPAQNSSVTRRSLWVKDKRFFDIVLEILRNCDSQTFLFPFTLVKIMGPKQLSFIWAVSITIYYIRLAKIFKHLLIYFKITITNLLYIIVNNTFYEKNNFCKRKKWARWVALFHILVNQISDLTEDSCTLLPASAFNLLWYRTQVM